VAVFPFTLPPCKSCGGTPRLLPAISTPVCMRCAACPGCGSKYRQKPAGGLDETCLVCGPLDRARQRKPFLEARPLTGSQLETFDAAGVSSVVTLFGTGRLGPGRHGVGHEPLETAMKVLRRTDGRWIVYGGPAYWPDATFYVGPSLVDAAVEMTLMIAGQAATGTRGRALGARSRSASQPTAGPRPWPRSARPDAQSRTKAEDRSPAAQTAAAPSLQSTPTAGRARGRRYEGCGHKRKAGDTARRCPLCVASQATLPWDEKAEGP
jgi:hypothetical protein